MAEGKKLEAVKYIRSNFNLDLKEAKSLADHIESNIDDIGRTITEIKNIGSTFTAATGIKKPTNAIRIIGKIFMGIGFLIFSIAGYIYFQQVKLIDRSISVIGTVEGNASNPTFKYEYKGNTYTHLSSATSNPPNFYLGEEVKFL